jgi:hypothetical protein
MAATASLMSSSAAAQSIPDSLLQHLRAGASRLVLPGDSVALPLVGTRAFPLVEVRVNGTGPYRFLIDLGSNVTLLRRSVVDRCVPRVGRTKPDRDERSGGELPGWW